VIEGIYNKEIVCPVCSRNFQVTKVKARACKVKSRDSDFCVHYEGINPIFYDAWVCENCGYANMSDRFEDISHNEANALKEKLMPKWKKHSLSGERDVDAAIEAFKLVLISNDYRKAKASEFAKACLRIAWLYRYKGDEEESRFIRYALEYYKTVYEKESFPVDKMDESTCVYIIGELSNRAGDYSEAVKWFSRLMNSAEARKKPALIEAAREQYQLVKDKLK
jgi:uncharacterized protein (DUF2225 family)